MSGNNSRPSSKDGPKKNIWSSMLDSVANGKRLPEKNLLILGGTQDTQREFLETLSADTSDSTLIGEKRKGRVPPIANQFALGYTYQDVLDADQEDTLARVSAYLLSEPSLSFAPLLKPLLTPQSVPETLVVILLDWSDPWTWIRRLREWVRLLRHVLFSLDDETKIVMEEIMTEWRDRKRGMDSGSAGAQGLTSSGGPVTIPLGPGEWDEGLGIPVCVVCQGADKIEKLEKDHGWREEEFDFILQFLRTILLKHGASLIYTTPFLANSLQSLIHSSLGIHSLLKRQSLKHNVIDRDKILVPPNWDSWGKIRIIREGFDMEGVSTAWSIEIQDPPEPLPGSVHYEPQDEGATAAEDGTSAVTIFEQTITDPKRNASMVHAGSQTSANKIEVETLDMQSFLAKQLEVLEQLKHDDEKDRATMPIPQLDMSPLEDNTRVNEHIGPVQFNMGGIQVDADDMVRKLKEREASRSQRKEILSSPGDEKAHNQALANFFAGLVKKPGTSPRGSPSA
ncbi:dynein family protein [Aspergillus clavatus NRRL 1]|uniref:Dynein light intermediate chain n=1 Tax=Aspergillus clavatus (strain ATCC 1007 / CBS 513.65 / DSM 816 / NCTC 3887 / NRRL 1 / QM 1276 / 107) TaxID=344612 RepID=A1CAK6_ASPCL|nr:dynein light intermediate chain [Aspergillus clavatus NRRL 1]EAW12774.1 dynein light intermediate chain [Aspergillus clavatus NRRL 1]